MSDNKFLLKIKGQETEKSLVEIQKDELIAPFADLPNSTPGKINIIDDTNTAVGVLKAAQNWILNDSVLDKTDTVEYSSEFSASGSGFWINSSYTFPDSEDPDNPVVSIINANSKWILRFSGKNLFSESDIINFTMVVKVGSTNITNLDFNVKRKAGFFCKKLIIDFTESQASVIKANGGEDLTLQLICNDDSASASIYNGSTVLSLLQRRIDADAVASDTMTLDDIEDELKLKAYDDEVVHLDGEETIIGAKTFTADNSFTGSNTFSAENTFTNTVNLRDIQFDLVPGITPQEGQMCWDADSGTVQFGLPGGTAILQVGQEMNVRAKNNEGATITNGSVVFVDGASGQRPTIRLADNSSITTAITTIGLATEDIDDNQFGHVTTFGLVRSIDTSLLTEGALVWLGENGEMTSVKPDAPRTSVAIGICVYQHATEGIVACNTTIIPRLISLSDVYVNDVQDRDILTWDATTGRFENNSLLVDVIENTLVPTGYPNRTDSTIDYDDVTRTVSVAPVSTSFDYFIKGEKYTQSSTISEINPDTTGNYFFYIDCDNVPQFTTTPWDIVSCDVLTGFVYYSAIMGKGVLLEERHGTQRNLAAHLEFHEKIGTYWVSGKAIADYTLQPVTPTDADNQFSLTAGYIADEDIRSSQVALSAGVSYNTWYHSTGNEWVWSNDTVPFIYTASGYINYNDVNTGTLVELATNNYVCYYVFAIPAVDSDYQTVIIAGQQVHSTLSSAQAEAVTDISWGTIPFSEFCPLYKVIFGTSAAYTSAGKCRIAHVEDLRTITERGITANPATSHQSLTNLQLAADGVTYGHIDDQAQDIAGVKNFLSSPTAPDPTTGSQVATKDYVDANSSLALPTGFMQAGGLIPNDGTDTDHDVTISIGKARCASDLCNIILSSALTKQADADWVAGSDAGGMPASVAKTGTVSSSSTTVTGTSTLFTTEYAVGDVLWSSVNGEGRRITAIASDTSLTVASAFTTALSSETPYKNGLAPDTTYHIFVIMNGSLVVDGGFDTQPDAGELLSGSSYTNYRRIGSKRTDSSSNFREVYQIPLDGGGLRTVYLAAILNFSATDNSGTAVSKALTVPLGIEIQATIKVFASTNALGANTSCYATDYFGVGRSIRATSHYSGNSDTMGDLVPDEYGQVPLTWDGSSNRTVQLTTLGYVDQRIV